MLLFYDDVFLRHDAGDLPESAERLRVIVRRLRGSGLWAECRVLPGRDARVEELARVHDRAYIERVREFAAGGGGELDSEVVISPGSYAAAIRAAGAAIDGAERIMRREAVNGFVLARPPGHHARASQGMGFCIFNNVAVAARHLLAIHGLRRVMIVDWDAHHGNGTQEEFYDEDAVFYLSVHAYPFYPGTGAAQERGRGKGLGFTRNLPIWPGAGREGYMRAWLPALRDSIAWFAPEFILVSAGFDAVRDDPIAGLGLEPEDFAEMTRVLCEAATVCEGRILSVLEGGYSLTSLPLCVEAHLRELLRAGGDRKAQRAQARKTS